jgi:hypothetical protein
MVRSAQSKAVCAVHHAISVARSMRHLQLAWPIDAQLQKRLRNGHFLQVVKELCGPFRRSLTTLRAPPQRLGIAPPDADSRHEKKFAQISLGRVLSMPTGVRIARIGTNRFANPPRIIAPQLATVGRRAVRTRSI